MQIFVTNWRSAVAKLRFFQREKVFINCITHIDLLSCPQLLDKDLKPGESRMKRNIVCAFSGGVICLFVCALAWAQATAQISGTVKDQTGAVLPGVEVTATQ